MMPESHSGCSSAVHDGSGEIMLFGVRVKVDPMRKSVSMNDLSQYVQVQLQPDPSSNSNSFIASAAVAAASGYASADDAVRNQSNAGRERKRGVPWTEDEHKLFLLGLQKVGKGDWRGISRNFVKTRTPTQVASHAQKYFLRRSNLNRRRRRSSLFDITTDLVAATPVEKQQVQEDSKNQPAQRPTLSSNQTSPLSGFPMAAFPATADSVPSQLPIKNQTETATLYPTPNPSTRPDNFLNQSKMDSLSLSLNLSLSYDHNNRTDSAAFSGFNNGNGIISVG